MIAFQNAAIGFKHLSKLNLHQHAKDWALTFERLGDVTRKQLSEAWLNPDPVARHPLLQVLIDQPAPSRTQEQRKSCLAIGALALMTIGFQIGRTPANFSAQLKQLFRSNHESWLELSSIDFLDVAALKAWVPLTQVAVVHEFREALGGLHRHAIPSISSFLTPVERAGDTPAIPTTTAVTEENPLQTEKPEKKPRKDPLADVSPRLDMFEVQKQRDCQDDIVDGYRRPLHWGRLHPDELKRALGRLNTHLKARPTDETSRRLRAHAALRYVSLFCGMSLMKCIRLPLGHRGSMKLDIAKGVIRRDLLLVAPRMDLQDRKRINGRWWRTRLPKDVRDVLQELLARHPGAKSLGALIKGEGLTYEACQHMLNDDWPTLHKPDDSRFALSLRPCLLGLGIHPAVVARVTGDTMTTPASDHYYLSFSEARLHEAMVIFCRWADLTPPDAPVRNRIIGTPKAISTDQFKGFIEKLNQKVAVGRGKLTPKSSIKAIIEFHNLYTCAVALQLIWGIGGRGDRVPSLSFERLFASADYLAISDRRVDRYSRQRIVPSTQVLTATRCHYTEHLRSIADSLQRACQQSTHYVAKVVAGMRPHDSAFFIFEETTDGWIPRSLQRKDLTALATALGVVDLNVSRHFWFTELVELDVAQVAIEALLGHHMNGAEAFGFSSGISVREVCNYLRPILEEVHQQLGFEPLIGRGRQASRYLDLPDLAVRSSLRHLPSVLLKRKLDVQDFLIPEVAMYEQDPPSTCKTLVAHAQLGRLKQRYVIEEVVRTHPAGALLFCLIARELVLTPSEQEALLNAAITDGLWMVGKLAVVEAEQNGRPAAQRPLSNLTLAAALVARAAHAATHVTYASAREQLHCVLKLLDPLWRGKTSNESTTLLATMASHWAAIEIPAGSLFGVFHKAPFIPVRDLARLHHQRPCLPQPWENAPPRASHGKTGKEFEATLEIVNKWGNKDMPLGEARARSVGCLAELRARRKQNDVDEAEQTLIDLLCADLSSDAPYRQLSPTTLPEYSRGYATYFTFVRREGTPQLEPETLLEAYRAMGGPKDFLESGPVRWQMLHISSFLHSREYWAPAAFISGRGKKTPALARLPVYTSQAEIASACQKNEQRFKHQGGTYAYAGVRLKMQRTVPVRVSEPRYSRVVDYDPQVRLFHITSTGHDHLKSQHSRGSVQLQEPLAAEVALMCERRKAIAVGAGTLLFCDAHLPSTYAAFDAISDAIRDAVVATTGCLRFRQHDLRAAAVSDACFELETELARACAGEKPIEAPPTAESIARKHVRFAWASRLARHASSLTTLRYYNCTGMLDLHCHLKLAHSDLQVSAKYLAALAGTKAQTLYAASHRARKSNSQSIADTTKPIDVRFAEFTQLAARSLPTPELEQIAEPLTGTSTSEPPSSSAEHLMEACLHAAMGASVQEASDATQLPKAIVSDVVTKFRQRATELKIRIDHTDRPPLLAFALNGDDLVLAQTIRNYARWLSANKKTLQNSALALIPGLARCGSRLIVKSETQMVDLLPLLNELHDTGFRVVFRLGPNRLLQQHPSLERELNNAQIEIHRTHAREDVFGVVSFLLKVTTPDPKVSRKPQKSSSAGLHVSAECASPRTYGRAGRLAIAGLLLGLSL